MKNKTSIALFLSLFILVSDFCFAEDPGGIVGIIKKKREQEEAALDGKDYTPPEDRPSADPNASKPAPDPGFFGRLFGPPSSGSSTSFGSSRGTYYPPARNDGDSGTEPPTHSQAQERPALKPSEDNSVTGVLRRRREQIERAGLGEDPFATSDNVGAGGLMGGSGSGVDARSMESGQTPSGMSTPQGMGSEGHHHGPGGTEW